MWTSQLAASICLCSVMWASRVLALWFGRVPEMPWLSSGRSFEMGSLDEFAGHALFPGETLEPGLPAPVFERPAPDTVDGFAPVAPAYQATALIFVPEYAPECVTASLRVGMSVAEAIAAFARARGNERAENFAAFDSCAPSADHGLCHFCVSCIMV